MNRFLLNIEKYRFAILGTLVFHIVIFVVSSFTQVQNVMRLPPDEVVVEVPLEDIELEPELEEILELNKEPLPTTEVANLARNSNDTRERAYENYSLNKEDITEDAMLNAKELERQFFEEAAANNPKNSTQKNAHVPVETKADKIKDRRGDESSGGAENAFAGEVMISYDLPGRNAFSLPNPGYTCKSSGVVVIEIKVDASGTVRATQLVRERSVGATECLVQRATRYAKKSRFNMASSGSQTGTITYKFVGQ